MRDRRSACHPPTVHQALAFGGLLVLVGGCAFAPLHTPLRATPLLPADIAAYYDYPEHHPQATRELIRARPPYREFLIHFPLSVPPGFEPTESTVELEWFESTAPGRRPAILFNPILGGDYPIERGLCRTLASHGFHVALVHRKTLKIGPDQDVVHLERLLRQGVLRIRQAVDWMSAQERVDPNRLGSFGISMGGIATVMAAAAEPRLRCHMVALAGGSLTDVLISSRDPLLAKPRARYLAHRHMDLKTLEAQLRQTIKTDPILLAPYVDPQRLFLVIALADHTIGRANALRLRRALGDPPTVFLPLGHYTAYFSLPYLNYASLRFFSRTLAPAQP